MTIHVPVYFLSEVNMKYPNTPTIIDVTQPPYCADNTGKIDCTNILRQILDDVLIRHIEATEAFKDKMYELSDGLKKDTYVGFECGRVEKGVLNITMPEYEPFTKIIYFPNGIYKVSDTITYTLKKLKNKYYIYGLNYDLSRNIHFLGESKENTIIRLDDNSDGFYPGSLKPLLSFNTNDAPRNKEVTNTCQMNMLEDITLDMGKGNGGIGVRYISSNIGRIENVNIVSEIGTTGIYTVFGSEVSLINITVSGFNYGLDIQYSSLVSMSNIDVSNSKIAGILSGGAALTARNINSGSLDAFHFTDCRKGRYLFDTSVSHSDKNGNTIFIDKNNISSIFPKNKLVFTKDNYAYVDDYGAVGDGTTDCTEALKLAFNSGKQIILFGEGRYLIENKISVPASVQYIDFNFCQLTAGDNLINGIEDCAFLINESSDNMLFIENLYTQEQFYGHMHLIKQTCVRDVVLSDLQTTMACMYINTVGGSKIYLDNVFMTTGTYSENLILKRGSLQPIYSKNIPLVFFNQTVYGRGINAERADLAILNDGSEILIDGLRTEGPGTAVRTINGGKTTIHIYNAGIGNKESLKPLFESTNSEMHIYGACVHGFDKETEYNVIVKEKNNIIRWDDLPPCNMDFYKFLDEYHST